jgi:hypothetical protein
VVTTAFGAAGHLHVDEGLGSTRFCGQRPHDISPGRARERIADTHLGETAFEPLQVLAQAKGAATVHGHHLVDAVCEEEAAIQR